MLAMVAALASSLMNALQKQRFQLLFISLIGLAVAAALLLYAFRDDMNAYLTPTALHAHAFSREQIITLGGVVKKNSVIRRGLDIDFIVTDFKQEISVHYHGVLPDLFHEGKGVIANGTLTTPRHLEASAILAKHDENYTPVSVQP
jgi:cytochrome c-type biogenesis protein CcmE